MFDKIAIVDNKIQILRHSVAWQEHLFDKDVSHVREETETSRLEEMLTGCGISYTVTAIEVPAEMEQYDGAEWTSGRDKAILYINGMDEYSPVLVKIKALKQQLADMDYKTSKYADGEYDAGEWEAIKQERKDLRRRIRELEV